VPDRLQLGEALRAEGLVDEDQLATALAEQARFGHRLGETLVRLGLVAESALVRVLAGQLRVPAVDLSGKTIEPDVLERVPATLSEKYQCLPLFTKRQGGVELLYLGMDDPTNLTAIDDVSFRTGLGVRPVLVGPVQLRDAIALYYHGEEPPNGGERGIAEAPVVPGDTAPVLPDEATSAAGAGAWESHDLDLAPGPDPADPTPTTWQAAPLPAAATPEPLDAPATAQAADEALAEGSGSKPRDVPTRQILQAVTRLLLDKGVVTRAELMAGIRAVQTAEAGAEAGVAGRRQDDDPDA